MKKKTLSILFIITSILLLIYSFNFVTHFIKFNKHREYFEQPIEEQITQRWMSVNYIEKTYLINFEEEFGTKIGLFGGNESLGTYCDHYKINCDEFIITLEQYRNGN